MRSLASMCGTRAEKVFLELAALPAFAAEVCDRRAWNTRPCQHLQHMCRERFLNWEPYPHLQHLYLEMSWNWQACRHLLQMRVTATSGICSPVGISSTSLEDAVSLKKI